ncbi:MAG: molybdopterin oxidoreductase family protein, partial [Bellilinea sp.]
MEELEFLVAQDLFINESGAFADVFLPAAAFAEKDGTFTNTDRRVQLVKQAIPPRGQARADWQIICDLAKRLEKRLGPAQSAFWDYSHPAEILEEMGRYVPDYAGVKYHRLEKAGLQTPVPTDDHPGTPYLYSQSFPRGRGKFHPLEYVPNSEMPDDEYPFVLSTGRVLEHWHGGSMTRNSWMDDLFPEALLEINSDDATQLGIANGDPVRVTSRRGSIALRASVTPKANPGVVFIPFHFWEAAANILTTDALDPQAKIPEYKAGVVRITRANEEELTNAVAPQIRGRY